MAMMDVVFWTIIGGIIGARLLFVAIQWRYFRDLCVRPEAISLLGVRCVTDAQCYPGQECDGAWCVAAGDCFAAFKFWQGGWVFLGGMLGAVPAALLAARVRKVDPLSAVALLITGLPLGHFFGRIGCMVQGCCFGKRAEFFMAVAGRHPTQLYEAAGELVIFVFMAWRFLCLSRGGRRPSALELASIPAAYLLLYAPLRFTIEIFRGDYHRGYLFEVKWPALAELAGFSVREPAFLSTSQAICLVLFAAAALFWLFYRCRSGRNPG